MSQSVESTDAEVPQRKILQELLKKFSDADDAKEIQESFRAICNETGEGKDGDKPYKVLSQKTDFHRAQNLRKAFDSKFNSKDYKKDGREACKNKQVLVVGAGPCGLRAAIELVFLGFRVVVVEKRNTFSRNSVLQVWTFLVDDLKSLGFRELYPKFGLSDRNHVSIRRLQIVLMKIALLLGVDVQLGVEFETVEEPGDKDKGWRARLKPANHPTSKFDFEVLIVANGQQNIQLTDLGFSWTKIERKLAIAIAANFQNKNKKEDFDQEDMGGVSIMNKMEIFTELKAKKDVDIENLVYLRDETHYFVMTGKKENLLKRGVLREDTGKKSLLNKDNIDREKLKQLAKDVASHCTKEKIDLKFSEWANGEADVAMFEFTSRSHANEAAIVKEAKNNKKLLMGLVGDSLKQPFWPEGVGIAHGIFSVYDTAWMVYEWFSGKVTEEEVIENRKTTYNCLRAMTKESLSTIREYGIDPKKRYAEYRAIQSPKVVDIPSTSKVEKPVNARKLDLGELKPVQEEKQQGVEDLMDKFGGGKKRKPKKEDETDQEAADKKKQKSKGISRLFFWRGGKKKKKASSTENIDQKDNKGKKDGGEFKRGRFRSFRKSFRLSRRKKEKRIQEDKGAENDAPNQS